MTYDQANELGALYKQKFPKMLIGTTDSEQEEWRFIALMKRHPQEKLDINAENELYITLAKYKVTDKFIVTEEYARLDTYNYEVAKTFLTIFKQYTV